MTANLYGRNPQKIQENFRQPLNLLQGHKALVLPASCESARLELASAVIAEVVLAFTVETSIGALALAAAALAVAQAGLDVQEQCRR